MIAQLDVETTAAANELKIFRLKNALATDVGPVLQDALNWQLVGSRVPLGATPGPEASAPAAKRSASRKTGRGSAPRSCPS